MVENLKAVRRPRGRPRIRPDEETRRLIIEAARHEFQTNGYAQASMASVAQKAGISTKTMYRLVPTKADLFRSVVSDRISRFMLELDPEALDAFALEDALERMLVTYGSLTLDGETIAMIQLVIGECDRFPEIAAAFYETAICRVGEAMEAWLQRQCDRGLIDIDDVRMATGLLRGMMVQEPQRAVMLGQRVPPDHAEISGRAQYCARIFLDGCRRRQCPGAA